MAKHSETRNEIVTRNANRSAGPNVESSNAAMRRKPGFTGEHSALSSCRSRNSSGSASLSSFRRSVSNTPHLVAHHLEIGGGGPEIFHWARCTQKMRLGETNDMRILLDGSQSDAALQTQQQTSMRNVATAGLPGKVGVQHQFIAFLPSSSSSNWRACVVDARPVKSTCEAPLEAGRRTIFKTCPCNRRAFCTIKTSSRRFGGPFLMSASPFLLAAKSGAGARKSTTSGSRAVGGNGDSGGGGFDRKPSGQRSWWQSVLGVGAAGYGVFKILPGLKIAVPLLKMSKMGPLLSLVLSSLAYTAVFGWKYGLGMISLIFIHEMGHALMMRRLGVPAGPMTFLPFLGAVVEMKDHPRNAYDEAVIAIAGPVLGSCAALVPFACGLQTGDQLMFALANWGFMVNLFNLIPVGSLDGGRIMGALSPWFLVAGLAGNGALIATFPSHPMLYLTFLGGSASAVFLCLGYSVFEG